MNIVYNSSRSRYEAFVLYGERTIAKEAGWRWDPNAALWWTDSEEIASRFAQHAKGKAAVRLMALSDGEREALAASTAHNSDLDIPAPPELVYLPYQRAGIAYAISHRGTLMADEMGMGKTIQAIGVANELFGRCFPIDNTVNRLFCGSDSGSADMALSVRAQKAPRQRRALIICPASLRLNWKAEWERWHTGPVRAVLLDRWPEPELPGGDGAAGLALIVSYDSVVRWHPMIAEQPWDVLILDEAHMVKNGAARRTRTIFGGNYGDQTFRPLLARRKLFLTGTPIVNKPAELWTLVHALDPEGLGINHADFKERYCKSNDRLGELHVRLRSRIMVRRLKADVLPELPAKRRSLVLLDVPGADQILASENEVISLARKRLERTRSEIADLPHREQVMRLRECRALALSEISRVRHETALAKLPQVIEHVKILLDNSGKIVVFGHHHDVLDGLRGAFDGIWVGLDGRTPESERQASVREFQRGSGRIRLFIGSMRAAGLGVTLTAASTVVFAELDWTPPQIMQAEDRLHRIGQFNPVNVYHLVIDGSIDLKMAKILIAKQGIMDQALDGGSREENERPVLEELLR